MEKEEVSIGHELENFFKKIEGLAESLPIAKMTLEKAKEDIEKRYIEFLKKHAEGIEDVGEGFKKFILDKRHGPAAKKYKRLKESFEIGDLIFPQTFVVALVSQYDFFLGRLIRCLFLLRPELLNETEKQISISQLYEFGNIERIKEFVLEKKVENVLRDSHADQFAWLEKKFNVELRKNSTVLWPDFIELTERRNLFVHCDGVISSQYIDVCKKNGVQFEQEPKVGEKLEDPAKYFATSFECILEIGLKLGQVLWRSQHPSQLEEADKNLAKISLELIVIGRYSLAIKMLDFACLPPIKHFNDDLKRILIINRAQAYKWFGDAEKCKTILQEHDWSASSLKFRFALAVLQDDFEVAADLMKKIGPAGEVREIDYFEWPLFKTFRQSEVFSNTFKEVFGKAFSLEETPTRNEPSKKTEKDSSEKVC